MERLPIYKATIADADAGMFRISLVDDPAVESLFLAFDKQKPVLMYKVSDEEKRLVRGVVMRADFPIYRNDSEMGEYYIIFKKDDIREIAEKYLLEGRQNEVNLMHRKGSDVDGVQMVQYFIKGDGVSVEGFDNISDGSLFAEFHIVNDDVWEQVKNGTYRGFSLEGAFNLERVKFQRKSNMSKLQRIKAALAAILQEFGSVTTDRGILVWDGDEDLKAGLNVYIEDAEGNRTDVEDGDYKTDDGKTIKVVDGKVSEIVDPEAEVAPVEEEKFGTKATDKGDLEWDGEEDLKAGDAVYTRNAEGEREPAADGDYTTEDGKVIKVVDGKVSEIVDADAEVAPVEESKKEKLKKVVAKMEASYEEKTRKIAEAIFTEGRKGYIIEAADTYAVSVMWENDYVEKFYRYVVTWEGDEVKVGDRQEVKSMFVPLDFVSPFEKDGQNEEQLRKENEQLRKENEQLKKVPAAKTAHEAFTSAQNKLKTGVKGLDKLKAYLGK